jgi:hypothetical protein
VGGHNSLEPTTKITSFNNGSKIDHTHPMELFPSIVHVKGGY